MGGPGSTRWNGHRKKTTVEMCWQLDIVRWTRRGIVAPCNHARGTWVWTDTSTGETLDSISYEVKTTEDDGWLRLQYHFVSPRDSGVRLDYKVALVTTRGYLGGLSWWFQCPLMVNGQACRRRVRKLYLPPDGTYFGCRHCHDLTYESRRR
jgi:hypothetical protein